MENGSNNFQKRKTGKTEIKRIIGCGFTWFKKPKFSLESYMSTNHVFLFFNKLQQKYLWKLKKNVKNIIPIAKKKIFIKLQHKYLQQII